MQLMNYLQIEAKYKLREFTVCVTIYKNVGGNTMNELSPYECQFTPENRKKIIAQIMEELREKKGYSQKQVAAFIKVKPTTYNTYESGRTEPPAEILVRLSYLYDVSLDILMQKDRLYKTSEDVQNQLDELKKQKQEIEQNLGKGAENPDLQQVLDSMGQLISLMEDMNKNSQIKDKLEAPMK